MLKKYTLIFCLSIAAVFPAFYIFSETQIKLSVENTPSPVSGERRHVASAEPAANDDIVAAILIMPKSFLPALKRFSQSKMAKNIKILPAQIRTKDGEMTAVYKNANEKHRDRGITPGNDLSGKTIEADEESPPEKRQQILATGFLYLLANVHKSRLFR
jgi:hypothetical protein